VVCFVFLVPVDGSSRHRGKIRPLSPSTRQSRESYPPDPSAVLVCCSVFRLPILSSSSPPICPSSAHPSTHYPLPTTPIHASIHPSIHPSRFPTVIDHPTTQPRTYTHTYTPEKEHGISLDTYIHIHTYTYTYTYEDDSLGMSLVMGMGACVTCEVGGWVHRW